MRVIIERHGGFAGIAKATTLDTATLSQTDRAKMQSLIEETGCSSPRELSDQPPGKPDRFQYTITIIADDGASQTCQFDEEGLPHGVRGLIDLARQKAGQSGAQSGVN